MNTKPLLYKFGILMILLVLCAAVASTKVKAANNDGMVALGKALFFDTNLSVNGTQSCAACHAPEVGFTGPDSIANASGAVYPGALPNHFGNRKPPASAYA